MRKAFIICLAGLSLGAVVSAAVSAPPDQPALIDVWRSIFARPDITASSIPAPADNPLSPARIELGRILFHDTRLSGSGDRSCATCHRAEFGYSDGRRVAAGLNGRDLAWNVPGLSNLAWGKRFFWDGRACSLEEQSHGPILNPDEMAGSWPEITGRLLRDPGMTALFTQAFPDAAKTPVTPQRIVEALAAYQRTLISPPTRFDRFIAGDQKALDTMEQQGFAIFVGRAGCVACHGGWRFTDDRLHDIGLPVSPNRNTDASPGSTAFKTPGLRELAHTAPYFHDGSKATLEDVVEHYNNGFVRRPELSSNIVRNLNLSAAERQALVAFLKTLSTEQPGTAAEGRRSAEAAPPLDLPQKP